MNASRPPVHTIDICGISCDPTDILLYFLAFFVPPFPILARVGFRSKQFVIGLLLSIFFHLPGLLYALYIVYDTSIITGSRDGLALRFDHLGYTPVSDSEAQQDNFSALAIEEHVEPVAVFSPTPQHLAPAQVYRDSPTPEQAGSSSDANVEGNLPSYTEAVGDESGRRIVSGDFKVQL